MHFASMSKVATRTHLLHSHPVPLPQCQRRALRPVVLARARRPASIDGEEAPAPLQQAVRRREALLLGAGLPCVCGCAARAHAAAAAAPGAVPPGWAQRFFAFSMAEGMQPVEERLRPIKAPLFAQLLGAPSVSRVLEVGVGAGPNFDIYAQEQQRRRDAQEPALAIVGLDINEAMFPYAQRSAQRAGLADGSLSLVAASAQSMPLEDSSVDAAVITLVLCSVPDVARTLSEVRRVVRPGGRVLLLEHVVAPQPGLKRFAQTALDPLQQLVADGCHLTRDTLAAVRAAGLRGADQLQQLDVEGLGILSPFIAGLVEV